MNHNTEIKLTKAQKSAIEYSGGHLQIIACAGSGKTEVLSRRIAHFLETGVHPNQIVAFTFTEKAAESLKSRIAKVVATDINDMYIGTIHGFCKYLLGKYTEKFSDFKVLDAVKNHLFINRYAEHCGMSTLALSPCFLNDSLFLQCIDKLIDDYDNRNKWTDEHRDALEKYIKCLYEHKYIDFSLLIFEALRQINESKTIQSYLKNIRHLIVDEYQDVNDIQEKLIASIASAGANVCVVGDDDQTIYQFRGSNADNMISFCERYPNTYQVRLEDNFRSQKSIVDIATTTIRNNERRLLKKMNSSADEKKSIVCANGYSNEDEEYEAIAEQIAKLYACGVPYHCIAVLTRKGKHIADIARKLGAKGIPFTADSAENFFEGNYFKRFVETLRTLNDIDKVALYEQWQDIVSGALFNDGFKYLRSCTRVGNCRLGDIMRTFCDKINFLSDSATDIKMRLEDLEGICKILDDYDEIYGDYQLSARITGLLRFLGTQATKEYKYHDFRIQEPNTDAVQLMTVHKSKGLEFHTVFLPQLNKREFPVANIGGKKYYHILGDTFAENKGRYESDLDDERKLFYVALTRAEKNLYLSYTLDKQPVSQFVAEASESKYLKVDRGDLLYQPPKAENPHKSHYNAHSTASYEQILQQEQERLEQEEYLTLVKYAREKLHDEYSVANHFCKGIILEYQEVCKKGNDAILLKARELGII